MVTFSVVVNLLFFSSAAIVLLKYIFRDNRVILQLDTRFLLVCMLAIMFRMLVPVESPVSSNIAVSKVYPEVYRVLKEPIAGGSRNGISIIGIMEFIWFAGAAVRLARLLYSYMKTGRAIRNGTEIRNPRMLEIMEKVNRQYRHPAKFRLIHHEEGSTPCVFGIWKPCIVLTDIEVTGKELEFIFSHEMGHYYRGDLLVIMLREVFSAVYWWDPFAYMLNDLIAQTQEINVDFGIMRKLTRAEILDYSACLVRITKERERRKREERWLMSFQKEGTLLLGKRVRLMMENLDTGRRKTAASVLVSVVMAGLIAVCPNVVIFEPYAIPETDADGNGGLRGGEVYYLVNEHGTYDLFIDGEYIMTSETVFDENIPVCFDDGEVKEDG